MAVYYRPKSVLIGTTAITTVSSVSVNENHSTGSFAGDDDNYAMGWDGAATVSANLQLADIGQAKTCLGYSGVLTITHAAAGSGSDTTTSVSDMKVVSMSVNNPFDSNSGCTLNLAYVAGTRRL